MTTEASPLISTGSSEVVERATRGGLQGITGGFIVEGLTVFNLAHFTDRQAVWATVAFGFAVSFIQNWIEQRRGRKLIGAAPPVDSPVDDDTPKD